jgi:DNA-binding HxlR family transcriptional regulator
MLSEHGRSVVPVVEAIRQWGHEHLRAQTEGGPPHYVG